MQIITTSDGSHSLLSAQFGTSYHSEHGAVQESQHVFIDAGLKTVASQQSPVKLFEMGFGSGLNAFMAYLYAQNNQQSIEYHGVELYPLPENTFAQLNYAQRLDAEPEAPVLQQMHLCPEAQAIALGPYFTFTKYHQDLASFHSPDAFNLIFYDAFGPGTQPELWDENTCQKLYNMCAPHAVLVTYCAQGAFRRNLIAAGFSVERLAGPPGKREMIRALKPVAALR